MSTFSHEQKSETGKPDANLLLRHCKLDLMSQFMEIKSSKPKLTQKQLANEFWYSESTIKLHGNDIRVQSCYRSNETKRTQTTSIKHKRNQMTSSPRVADSTNETGTAKKSVQPILHAVNK